MRQITDHANAVSQFFERLEGFGKLERGTFLDGGPFVHRGAVRDINAAESGLGNRGRLAQWRLRGNHRIQQRQRERNSHPAQKRSPRQMLFSNEHLPSLPSLAFGTERSSQYLIPTLRTGRD